MWLGPGPPRPSRGGSPAGVRGCDLRGRDSIQRCRDNHIIAMGLACWRRPLPYGGLCSWPHPTSYQGTIHPPKPPLQSPACSALFGSLLLFYSRPRLRLFPLSFVLFPLSFVLFPFPFRLYVPKTYNICMDSVDRNTLWVRAVNHQCTVL